jgi:hypothetical protein
MRGIRGLLPSSQMASRIPASGLSNPRQVVVVIDMARGTRRRQMRAGQHKTGCAMFERRSKPRVHPVALLAGCRETRFHVVWYARAKICSVLEILRMAGIARRRQPRKLADRRLLMAIIALQRCVRAQQREAVKVVLNCLSGNGPPVHGMALLAVGAELPPVNVGMAVRAF